MDQRCACSVLAYVILPAVLPAAVVNGGLVILITFVLLAISAVSGLRSLRGRLLLDSQTSLDSLRALPWKRFEDVLAEAYRRRGYQVVETLGGGADGGIDLQLRKNGQVIVVQCKRWRGKPIRVQVVRGLYGVMMINVLPRRNSWRQQPSQRMRSHSQKVSRLNSSTRKLQSLVRDVQTTSRITISSDEPDHLTPMCPSCNTPMVFREAPRGAHAGQRFWGCVNFPRCRGTRQL